MNIRQQLVECLEFAVDIEELGGEVSQWQQQLVQLRNDENRCDERTSRLRTIFLIVTGLSILLVGVVIASVVAAVCFLMEEEELDLQQLLIAVVSEGSSDLSILFLPFIAVALSVGFGYAWSQSARKLRRLQAENPIKQRQIEVKIQELQDRIRNLAEYGIEEGYFDIVPMDYFSSEMLKYCISVVDRKLATTLKEAFWLLEQELQRQEQMAQQQMWYDSQTEQMEQLTNAIHVNTMVTMLANQERHD